MDKQKHRFRFAKICAALVLVAIVSGCTFTDAIESASEPEQIETVQNTNDTATNQVLEGVQSYPPEQQDAILKTLADPQTNPDLPLPLPLSTDASSSFAPSDNLQMIDEDPLSQDAQLLEQQAIARAELVYSQMTHGSCKGGWAIQPDKLDAIRQTPGHPYYMEIRLRHTPLLPVGHTYIAYGRLSPEGTPLDEKLIMLSPLGGYGGAAIAAALPMPGVLVPVGDDCRLKPIAAYRVTLSAEDFEKMLLRIQVAQKKVPRYSLFTYNCNNFVSDITAPVGILPAKNKYLVALKYIYGIIEANEGFNPRKDRRG
ncbi:MAG: hypothetical protein L3J32_09910 [Rhizobiaceae bacterium]|nr:hypothetical protein [Rhizobiaceae bacterium]